MELTEVAGGMQDSGYRPIAPRKLGLDCLDLVSGHALTLGMIGTDLYRLLQVPSRIPYSVRTTYCSL